MKESAMLAQNFGARKADIKRLLSGLFSCTIFTSVAHSKLTVLIIFIWVDNGLQNAS